MSALGIKRHINLDELLDGLAGVEKGICVSELTLDSRSVKPGSCFIAIPGARVDGRDYVTSAAALGASAVLVEATGFTATDITVPIVLIDNLNAKLSKIAARFYNHPSREAKVIGVTGTNGKTSVCFYVAQALNELGGQGAVIGTIGYGATDALTDTGLTTPDAISVQRQLRELVDAGNTVICMEVSSHGLDQHRVAAVDFTVAVLTNISQDHLDYHGSMQSYAQAKTKLFQFNSLHCSVINADDELGNQLLSQLTVPLISYGWNNADFAIKSLQHRSSGLAFKLSEKGQEYDVHTQLIGDYNADNLVAAVATITAIGYQTSAIVDVLRKVTAPPGRLEKIGSDAHKPTVIVDFAHTPDALEQVLQTVKCHCDGEVSVVFGCGGDRDSAKRPLMGAIAEQYADRIVLTDDNPRGECPSAIIVDIMQGLKSPVTVLHNRDAAIRSAVLRASDKDWVLIAGKGHETEQAYADHTIEISDREIALSALANLGGYCSMNGMMSVAEASSAMSGHLIGDPELRVNSVEIDSRSVDDSSLFFAIRGLSQDGHDYVNAAVEQGATAVVIERAADQPIAAAAITVKDTTRALGDLATVWRARFSLPVVGVTGSNGKTTVSRIISTLFQQSIPGIAPQGSFNNHWGVPLTLLKLRQQHQSAVIEMGMNHPGELTYLGQIVKPTIAIITNASAAHLERLKSVEDVAKAKGEIIDSVSKDGVVVLNRDDTYFDYWAQRVGLRRCVTFGRHPQATMRLVESHGDEFIAEYLGEKQSFSCPLFGWHNHINSLGASLVALEAGISLAQVMAGLKQVEAVDGRLQNKVSSQGFRLIDDTYNANPASMKAAISVLASFRGSKILVLGTMGELGETALQRHLEVGELAKQENIDHVFVYCNNAANRALASKYSEGYGGTNKVYDDLDLLVQQVIAQSKSDSSVLVKGSRAAAMERVVTKLQEAHSC